MTITLKQALNKCQLTITELATLLGMPYSSVCLAVRNNEPPKRSAEGFKQKVTGILRAKGMLEEVVWSKGATEDQTEPHQQQANADEDTAMETQMLTHDAMKHFKLFRNPFVNDIREASDIYLNEDGHYILAAMKDAARNQGILAVIGDSGAGKSVLRRLLLDDLNQDGDISVIQPKIIDKTRATAAGICDAIITDISSEQPKRSMESKARQVERLLSGASQSGQKHVLIIEEAHDLTVPVLKYLKRFWELEDGFSKLLGIMLIGQTELKTKLDERRHYELREFIRRCMVVEMTPIDRDSYDYLQHKFARLGINIEKIIQKEAVEALRTRLMHRGTHYNSTISPQLLNNAMTKAMNLAACLGEEVITAELVREI